MNIGFKIALASIPWFIFWFLVYSAYEKEKEKYEVLFGLGTIGSLLGIAGFFLGICVGIVLL